MSHPDFPLIPASPTLDPFQQGALARVAWEAVERTVRGVEVAVPELPGRGEVLEAPLGVFVTLYGGDQLRGCLGAARPAEPLLQAVGRLAAAAARADPRFSPLRPEELDGLRVEITCLGELVELPADPEAVLAGLEPSRHGVCLEAGGRRGLLLPQVAERFGWSGAELLEAVAEKAGLPAASWRRSDARVLAFRACSFEAPRPASAAPPGPSPGPSPGRPSAVGTGVLGRLREAGLLPRHGLGQHFLHDPKLLAALARDAAIEPEEIVFEVGTGPATLTRVLARSARQVITVEVDPAMMRFAREELREFRNVTFLQRDVLDGSGGLDPEVASLLRTHRGFTWVSNLPYQVATRLVVQVCEEGLVWARASLLVQHEVALRLCASPGDSAYGPATALLAFWVRQRRRVRRIPAGAFWPAPRVDGSVVSLSEVTPLGEPGDYPAYAACVRRLFAGRRKQLQRLLRDILGPEHVERALALGGWDPRLRPEKLAPADFLKLSREFPFLFLDCPS